MSSSREPVGFTIICSSKLTDTYMTDNQTFEESLCAKIANPSEITAITFESGSNRLAVANHNSIISLFRVGSKMDLHPIFTVSLKNHVPKALAFGQTGEDKDIYTFGLYDGVM